MVLAGMIDQVLLSGRVIHAPEVLPERIGARLILRRGAPSGINARLRIMHPYTGCTALQEYRPAAWFRSAGDEIRQVPEDGTWGRKAYFCTIFLNSDFTSSGSLYCLSSNWFIASRTIWGASLSFARVIRSFFDAG